MNKCIIPIKKNDEVEITISAYTSEGAGVGRFDGFAIFVPNALNGEKIRAHIVKVGKKFAIGKLIEVLEKNDEIRSKECCSEYNKCGGCDMQHMKYEEQLRFKRDRVLGALNHLGGLNVSEDIVSATLGSTSPLRYRNKAAFPFAAIDGKVRIGFFAPRSHRLVPINDCPIQLEDTVKAMKVAESWANKYRIPAFNETTGDGILRHLVVRSAQGKVLVTVVTSGGVLPFSEDLCKMLLDEVPNMAGLIHNINNKVTNVILGSKYKTIWGKDSLCDDICGLSFNVRTPSFLQVNHEQTEKLYNTVLSFLQLSGKENIYDIYCGIGTISLMLAKHSRRVIGIESVHEAVEDARMNAEINNITNADFLTGEAEQVLPELVAKGERADAIVIDPPRKGCETEVLKAIAESGAEQVVYVSCNPETLARDLKILDVYGYKVQKVQPVDMFPQTSHVETVVLMSRVEK